MTRHFTSLVVLFCLVLYFSPKNSQANDLSSDIRFILQTQGGLTAYTDLDTPIYLPTARQLLATIETETNSFVYGDYVLEGRTDTVKMALGAAGWLIAFHPPDYDSQHLIGCPVINRPEKAVREAAAALGHDDPVIGYYDARHPEATGIALHWLYTAQSDTITSTITLPLDNLYLERGYAFCTALANSQFHLNDQLIDQAGAVSSVIKRWGPLAPGQLRAGQTNTLQISAMSFFGIGFFAGVSAVYTGSAAVSTEGGVSQILPLHYPTMLGEPLVLSHMYLPTIRND